jgi:hypothetical protein
MTNRLSSSRTFIFRGKQPSSVRLPPITYHREIAGAFPPSSIVVSELPKTATGKVQEYVRRVRLAISKQ